MSDLYDDSWREMPCELWEGLVRPDGYGYTYILTASGCGKTTKRAHVLTWEECFGPVPDGLFVLHKCDNPPCRQPLHLWLGKQADNVRDMREKGRARGGHSGRTACTKGHVYEDGSYYETPLGRSCRQCAGDRAKLRMMNPDVRAKQRVASREWKARRKERT